ncbi:hypothetical protein [Winogradskyella vidalii]|uniref:hypothetical protein n=1 Tax=Winogradskyella vidalii TaxID=2615024 RepID=UPI0015C6EB44|nr:hypothetical protein [Winogradskyella vidalii]
MKLKHYLITALIIFTACEKTDDTIIANETLMIGTWLQTETSVSVGGPQYWVDVEEGESLMFFENGTFSSNRFTECTEGNFSIIDQELHLDYNCDQFSTEYHNEDGIITYDLNFKSSYFILTPTSGLICVEGCKSKYQKI